MTPAADETPIHLWVRAFKGALDVDRDRKTCPLMVFRVDLTTANTKETQLSVCLLILQHVVKCKASQLLFLFQLLLLKFSTGRVQQTLLTADVCGRWNIYIYIEKKEKLQRNLRPNTHRATGLALPHVKSCRRCLLSLHKYKLFLEKQLVVWCSSVLFRKVTNECLSV